MPKRTEPPQGLGLKKTKFCKPDTRKLSNKRVYCVMDFNNLMGSATILWSVFLDSVISLFRDADEIVFSIHAAFVGDEFIREYIT